MVNIYAASLSAGRLEGSDRLVRSLAFVTYAHSEDEALGKALRAAREFYPSSDGWVQQGATVVEISREYVNTIYSMEDES